MKMPNERTPRTRRQAPMAILLSVSLLMAGIAACQTSNPTGSSEPTASPASSGAPTTRPTTAPTPAPTPVATADPEALKLALLKDVREAVEDAAPGSAIAVEQLSLGDIRLAGLVAPPATRAVVLSVVLGLDGVRSLDTSGLVDATFGPEIVGAPVGDEGATLAWDPASEFIAGPEAPNPGPDSYGNEGVWSYLFDESSKADGYVRDPSGYAALPTIDDATWTRPGYLYLIVGKDSRPGQMRMHPFGGRVVSSIASPVLRWRSPFAGFVRVTGSFSVGDPSCNGVGTGVIFSIDREATNVYTANVDAGEAAALNVWTRVSVGDSLYVIVDPGRDANCDTTLLRMKITSR